MNFTPETYPRLRKEPNIRSCACGCGNTIRQIHTGALRLYWGRHAQKEAWARYRSKPELGR